MNEFATESFDDVVSPASEDSSWNRRLVEAASDYENVDPEVGGALRVPGP